MSDKSVRLHKGEISKGNMVGMVLIDLQKAFNTVDHVILKENLNSIGVALTAWFDLYLADRKQCVDIGGTRSEFLSVTCVCLSQGSNLGPPLYLIYINDMSISLTCKLSLYMQTTLLFFSNIVTLM